MNIIYIIIIVIIIIITYRILLFGKRRLVESSILLVRTDFLYWPQCLGSPLPFSITAGVLTKNVLNQK